MKCKSLRVLLILVVTLIVTTSLSFSAYAQLPSSLRVLTDWSKYRNFSLPAARIIESLNHGEQIRERMELSRPILSWIASIPTHSPNQLSNFSSVQQYPVHLIKYLEIPANVASHETEKIYELPRFSVINNVLRTKRFQSLPLKERIFMHEKFEPARMKRPSGVVDMIKDEPITALRTLRDLLEQNGLVPWMDELVTSIATKKWKRLKRQLALLELKKPALYHSFRALLYERAELVSIPLFPPPHFVHQRLDKSKTAMKTLQTVEAAYAWILEGLQDWVQTTLARDGKLIIEIRPNRQTKRQPLSDRAKEWIKEDIRLLQDALSARVIRELEAKKYTLTHSVDGHDMTVKVPKERVRYLQSNLNAIYEFLVK